MGVLCGFICLGNGNKSALKVNEFNKNVDIICFLPVVVGGEVAERRRFR